MSLLKGPTSEVACTKVVVAAEVTTRTVAAT